VAATMTSIEHRERLLRQLEISVCLGTLREVEEFLDDQVDVVDGPEGRQLPNRAMQLLTEVRETIKRIGG
jgi:hypothetical protein